ncbi:hypothetical protein ACQP3C_27795, partial [Escherichia coli]
LGWRALSSAFVTRTQILVCSLRGNSGEKPGSTAFSRLDIRESYQALVCIFKTQLGFEKLKKKETIMTYY